MSKLEITTYQADDENGVIRLWQRCGLIVPWNDPRADIARKCADSPELFFVGRFDARVVATCMAGYDGHRGWIYYLTVDSSERRQGIAGKMLRQAEGGLSSRGCPKIDLMVRNTNQAVIAFYENAGYRADPVAVLSKRLIEDDQHGYS